MPATIEQIQNEALTLSESDRAQLAQKLLQSLESTEAGVEEAWDVEVSLRMERVREGTAEGRPADEVFRDICQRYQA